MTLAPGSRVGSYEVIDLVGAGGMGEVYRAHDPRLGRHVAIKIIPASFATDADRVRRFEQEARAAAALSHPNILAVYDVGTHADPAGGAGDAPYIVSELLEGQTLREQTQSGPLPVRKAVDVAVQIAHGLAAAHEKGIVHRDLKPDNVFVTDAGHVKILDFGLAKLIEVSPRPLDASTKRAETRPGEVMGTAGYMAPEQLRGLNIDQRSDIFAFGAVLYELLAGTRAFPGETSADVTTAILKEHPADLPAAERHIPPALIRIVDRCLEKNPSSRFQSAGDLAFALETLSAQTGVTEIVAAGSGAGAIAGPRGRSWLAVAGAGLALGLLVMYGVTRLLQRAPDEAVATSFPLTLPDGVSFVSGTLGGGASPGPLAVSPDGRFIAMLATGPDGTRSIWVRSLSDITPRLIPGTADATSPFWSPDGRHLAFFAVRKLKRVDVSGGPPIELCDVQNPLGGTWSQHGVIVFGQNSSGGTLRRVPDSGGEPASITTLAEGESIHSRPYFLPDGRRFVFRAIARGLPVRGWVYLGSLDSAERTQLVETDSSNTLYSAGHLLFLRGSTLMAQPFDAGRAALTGDAYPVAENIQAFGNLPVGVFTASAGGVLAYKTGAIAVGSDLVWFDRKGERQATLVARTVMGDLRLSRDGTRVAISRRPDLGGSTADIWLVDTATGQQSRFTFDAGNELSSGWSPDGRQIAFNSSRRGPFDLFVKPADGSGAETELLADSHDKFPVEWSSDGRHLLFTIVPNPAGRRGGPGDPAGTEGRQRLWALPLTGDRNAFPVSPAIGNDAPGGFSPDPASRWLTYSSQESARPEVYVVPFPPTGAKWQISSAGGLNPRWNGDGKEIFFIQPGTPPTLMAARVDVSGTAVKVIEITPLFRINPTGPRSNYVVSPDGKRFLFNVPATEEQTAAPSPPTVVVNWPSWRGK